MTPDWRKRNRCILLRQTENSRLSFLTFRKLNNQYKLSSAQYSHSSYCSLDSAYQILRACFVFSSHWRIFHLYWETQTSPLPVKGCKFQPTFMLRILSSEGSLTCHTYCDSRHPFIWSSMRTCDTHTYCWERVAIELSLPVLTTDVFRGWDSNTHPPSACGANALIQFIIVTYT